MVIDVLLRLAYLGVANVFALLRLLPMSSRDKDAEILALRHQLSVLQRQLGPDRVRFTPGDRALLHRLPRDVLNRLHLVVRPDTVLRWHRHVVARRHAERSRPRSPGRPHTVRSIRVLVLRLVRENPGWGYRRVHGELLVPGIKVAASTVWEILHDAGIDPAPERSPATWAGFLRSQAEALLACDFFETVTLSGGAAARARGDRACQPANQDPGRHRPPDGVLDGTGCPEPRDGPGGCRLPGTVPDQRPGREVPGPVRRHPR
jgi:putative transposase